jgi:hypothetical protein
MSTENTPSFVAADREIAYEQNVTGLEIAWADRIASFAREAVRHLISQDEGYRDDKENLQIDAGEIVSARLLNSERWANVKATEISDIAYEAVGKIIDGQD